jgi:hypothetical protein
MVSETCCCLEGKISSFPVYAHGNILRQFISDGHSASADDFVIACPVSQIGLMTDKEFRKAREPSLHERCVHKNLVRHKVIGIKITVKALVIEVQIPEPVSDVGPGIFLHKGIAQGELQIIGAIIV